MQVHSHTHAKDDSGDGIRFEYPLTEPFSRQEMLRFSSDNFLFEAPFTCPCPTLEEECSASDRTLLEQPLAEPQSAIDMPASSASSLPAASAMPIEIAICQELLHTQKISATDQQALRKQALRWKSIGHRSIHPNGQTHQQRLQVGFKHDAAALRERYIIDEVLAVGGTGIVYKAHAAPTGTHATGTNSSAAIAIKTLRPELRTNADAIQRLKHEFRYTAALRHPNIVPHYGLEQVAGIWFITMPLLGGRSLASLLNDSKAKHLSIDEALIILKACSAALSFAHLHGIVHCDLKPSNVWITDARDVLLIDFGAAQLCAASSRAIEGDTGVSVHPLPRLATPAYASPQVLAGKPAEPCDDIYSLACMAYELFDGRVPWRRSDAMDIAAAEVVQSDMRVQHSQRTSGVQALYRDIEMWFHRATAVPQVSSVAIPARQHPQVCLPQSELPSRLETYFESLSNVCAQPSKPCGIALAQDGALTESRSPPRSPFVLPTLSIKPMRHAAVQSKPNALPVWHVLQHRVAAKKSDINLSQQMRRNTAAICILVAIASLATFHRWAAAFATLSNFVTETAIQTAPIPALQPMPVMLALLRTSNDDSSIAAKPFVGQPFLGKRKSKAPWRIGFDSERNAAAFDAAHSRAKASRTMVRNTSIALDRQKVTVSDRAVFAVLLLKRSGSHRYPATVRWRTIANTAKPGTDYRNVPAGIARFADNQSARALYVQLKHNNNASTKRSFAVELSRPSTNAALGNISRAVITIESSN